MRRNKPDSDRRFLLQICFVAAAQLLGAFQGMGQQEPQAPLIELPAEEAIQQGRNKGVTTWEGTLFGQDSYRPGSYAQIEVVPNPGFEFERWEGKNIANLEEAKTFITMEDHVRVKAHYKRIWNIIAAPDNKEAGEVKGSGDYPDGTEVKLSVKPNDGFKFLGWEGKGINEEEKEALETTIVADGDHDIVARFENENQDQNQDQDQDQDEDQQDQDPNEDESEQDENQDPQDPNEDQQDPNEEQEGDQEDEPQEPEEGEDEPQEPEEGDEEEDQGGEEEQPEEPGEEEEAPGQEAPGGEQPMPLQMTPEEATRLLEAMEDGEKKLPLFIVSPKDRKKDNKKDW